jgi:hypothetical protein
MVVSFPERYACDFINGEWRIDACGMTNIKMEVSGSLTCHFPGITNTKIEND